MISLNERFNALGLILRSGRLACRLSQAAIAEHMGVSVRSVKAWESGGTIPRHRRLLYLLDYLEIPLQDAIRAKRLSQGLPEKEVATFTDLQV